MSEIENVLMNYRISSVFPGGNPKYAVTGNDLDVFYLHLPFHADFPVTVFTH